MLEHVRTFRLHGGATVRQLTVPRKGTFLKRARKLQSQLVAWRRDFHRYPELGFQETRTAACIAEEMEALGYHVRTGVGHTGIVAELGQGHPVFAIRADMDALPIQEANEVSYASQIPGVMHACGHDAHIAIALGTATLLAEAAFPGTVRFLFQPAEETTGENGHGGASSMIADGAMENVDAIVALHVDAALPVGHVTVASGVASAGVDTFHATIIGRGGHGAEPHEVVDPIYIAGYVILALNGIVSRRLRPGDPAVVSIGSIHGGKTDNVIPRWVKLEGTIRYLEQEIQEQVHAEIERALVITQAMSGDYELKINVGCPPMINDEQIADLIREVAAGLLGHSRVSDEESDMGAEDFGFLCALAPGAMFRLGCRIARDRRVHHSPRFDIDERCLPVGVAILSEIALRFLHRDHPNH